MKCRAVHRDVGGLLLCAFTRFRRVTERKFHKHVGAFEFGGMTRPPQMPKANLFVEVHRGGSFGVRLQVDAVCVHAAALCDRKFEKLSSDATATRLFRNGHLGQFKFAGRDRDQSTAADDLAIDFGDADLFSWLQDVLSRIAQDQAILGLEGKMPADPVFIQAAEGGFRRRTERCARQYRSYAFDFAARV